LFLLLLFVLFVLFRKTTSQDTGSLKKSLKESQEQCIELNKQLRETNKKEGRNTAKVSKKSGKKKDSSPVMVFDDEEQEKECSEAATKVQSQIRRQQTQNNYRNKKDNMKYEKGRSCWSGC